MRSLFKIHVVHYVERAHYSSSFNSHLLPSDPQGSELPRALNEELIEVAPTLVLMYQDLCTDVRIFFLLEAPQTRIGACVSPRILIDPHHSTTQNKTHTKGENTIPLYFARQQRRGTGQSSDPRRWPGRAGAAVPPSPHQWQRAVLGRCGVLFGLGDGGGRSRSSCRSYCNIGPFRLSQEVVPAGFQEWRGGGSTGVALGGSGEERACAAFSRVNGESGAEGAAPLLYFFNSNH
jgi:hypothetical protein